MLEDAKLASLRDKQVAQAGKKAQAPGKEKKAERSRVSKKRK